MKRAVERFIKKIIAPPLLFICMFLTGLTLRIRVIGEENEELVRKTRCIGAFWHKSVFYLPFHFRWLNRIYVLVSPSADGDLINGVARLLGYYTVRGSTFKNPRGSLLSLARKIRKGYGAAIVADGSRGPARKSQLGSVYLAKLTGVPIIPVAYDAKWKITINTWDKTIIPIPFSRVNVAVGNLITVNGKADVKELEEKNMELENELNRITELAGESFR